MFRTSLIISTYNWPEALQLCLKSVLRQKLMPGEIIIADDGSDARTKSVVDQFKDIAAVPVKHVWHSDEGFRLAAIRNKAIAAANGDYIIQIDGDMILHPYFIKDQHNFSRALSQPNFSCACMWASPFSFLFYIIYYDLLKL